MATTVAICCLISYLFMISLRHLYQGGKLQQLEWDMSTVTAGDYSVELKIDSDGYRNWYNNEYRKPTGDFENNVAPAFSLKQFLAQNIEKELTADLKRSPLHNSIQGMQSQEASSHRTIEEVKVADIVFSFKN